MEQEPDFYYRDRGTIYLLLPQSETARSWAEENLQPDHGEEDQIPIDRRMFTDILEGILSEGMTAKEE